MVTHFLFSYISVFVSFSDKLSKKWVRGRGVGKTKTLQSAVEKEAKRKRSIAGGNDYTYTICIVKTLLK